MYHQGELLYEKGGEESSYHLGGGIKAVWRSEKNHYYHQDEQLSTAFITNEKREIQNHYQYDAFGNGICQEEGISNRIRYTGQQYDGVTGQYYLRARYYNPIVGRFLQEDVYQGDGLNLYAYCGNNPVRYYDPSGYSKTPEVYNTGCPGATTNGDAGQEEGRGLDTAHLYRQMSEIEALATKAKKQLQHAIYGAEPTKWLTQSKEKAFQFSNALNEDVNVVVVDFEIKQEYMDFLNENSVKQRGSKKNPNNKFHYEGLPKPGPYKNFGILDENIEEFNKNVIRVTIIDNSSRQEK